MRKIVFTVGFILVGLGIIGGFIAFFVMVSGNLVFAKPIGIAALLLVGAGTIPLAVSQFMPKPQKAA